MRFIGCKENLLQYIEGILRDKNITTGVFCDIFTGTTVVARHFKKKGFKLITNDNLHFSYVLQKAYIENNSFPIFEKLMKDFFHINLTNNGKAAIQIVLQFLNNIPGKKGFIYENYSPEGTRNKKYERKYFTGDNAQRIDSIREIIKDWFKVELILENEFYVLLASLIEAVPGVSNISGTYGAFLKEWDPRAHKKLTLEIPEVIPGLLSHQVCKMDSNEMIKEIECDVLYIDPPYNTRQYPPNYHILETIATWDSPRLTGKTGMRPYNDQKSQYCQKEKCVEALEDLIKNARAKHILLSYNSEGLIPEREIKRIIESKGKLEITEIPHRRYKSHSHGKQKNSVIEKIYYVNTFLYKPILPIVSDINRVSESLYLDFYRKLEVEKRDKFIIQTQQGNIDKRNKLNDLTGREWLYFLNSVEVTSYPTKGKESYGHNLRKIHPSPKPPQLMKKIIEFFTKENQLVLDPFMGVGGTLLGCSLCNRRGVGIDLSEKYINIYKKVCQQENLREQIAIVGNSKEIDKILKDFPEKFDLILTDPPYGNMMAKKKTGEAKKKNGDDAPTPFTLSIDDLGNLPINQFLIELRRIIEKCINFLKDRKYLVIFTKDFQPTKKYHNMLHLDIVNELSKIDYLSYKGYKIWYDKTINLYPYGYPFAFVPNQLHQFILIFRKE